MISEKKKKILNLIKLLIEIRANPDDKNLREEYLLKLEDFLSNSENQLVKNDLDLFRKELYRFIKFASLKWGSDSDLYFISSRILHKVDSLCMSSSDNLSGNLSELCEEWDNANATYRPDEQALDYASQIIYETVISRKYLLLPIFRTTGLRLLF